MNASKILVYDGSFNGFLTAVFIGFEKKLTHADIQKNNQLQSGLFAETETIFTNVEKAQRVWNGVRKKSNNAIKNILYQDKSILRMCYVKRNLVW